MHLRDIRVGHMATHAIRRRLRTDLWGGCPGGPGGVIRCTLSRAMTAQTLLVVKVRISHQRRVRVMALSASKPRILGGLPATALLKAIGLEADGIGAGLGLIHDDVHHGSMTRSAEIDGACWREQGGIKDGLATLHLLSGHD